MPDMTVDELEAEVAAGRMRLPTYRELAEKLKGLSEEKSEWAGVPVFFSDYPIVLEPRFPYRFKACKIDETQQGEWEVVNAWYCHKWQATVQVQKNQAGRARVGYIPHGHGWKTAMLLGCLGVEQGWLPAAETKAMTKLWSMVGHHKFTQYTLTGTFLEQSKRSGVTYMFRRLRPTIAMRPKDGDMRVIATLCLHPIGYHQGSWGGCMVPTDDVIAHLTMMRGDEKKFWANANQHDPNHPNSGI